MEQGLKVNALTEEQRVVWERFRRMGQIYREEGVPITGEMPDVQDDPKWAKKHGYFIHETGRAG